MAAARDPQPEPGALLAAALAHCERLTAEPAAEAAALEVAGAAAAAALLCLAASPAEKAAELESAVRRHLAGRLPLLFHLTEAVWHGQSCVISPEALAYVLPQYGPNFMALAPALAAHVWRSQQAPELAARGAAAAAADVAAWAALAHRALSLMTDELIDRVKGVVAGTCAGGAQASYGSVGVSCVLEGAAAQLRAPSSGPLCVEWRHSVLHLAAFLCFLGEELAAGAAGAQRGAGTSTDGGDPVFGLSAAAQAAPLAARRAAAWPPRDPAVLAAAAAAALLLLSRWHALRAILMPSAHGVGDYSCCKASLRLQRRLPKACSQLVAAATAALDGSRKSRAMRQALPAALDAAATACKLVLLASSDAAHWTMLGAAAETSEGLLPDSPARCEPYQPVPLALAAASAAERSMRRLLLARGARQEPEAAYLRRRALALALQLCTSLEAAAATAGPLAEQALAAAASMQRLLASLLETGGACQAGDVSPLLLAGSLQVALLAARELAGPPVQQQLALAALPCANPACLAPAPGAGEAALRTSRCSRCLLARYCSDQCAAVAWAAHKACCRRPDDADVVTAAAASVPALPPADWPAPPRSRAKACPVCGVHLAADSAPPEGQVPACVAARSQRLAAASTAHSDDPAAAAAALLESVEERSARAAAEARTAEASRLLRQERAARCATAGGGGGSDGGSSGGSFA